MEIRSFPSGKSARFIRTKLILICNLPPFNTKTPPPHRKTNQKAFINKNEETAGRQLKWVIELKSILYLINHTALAVDFYSIKNYISKVHQKNEIWTEHRFLGQLASFNISKCPPHNQILLRVIR